MALVTLLLASAGVYAMMSVAVSRRTREIGIRLALGAGAHRVIRAIFSRALMQVTLGIALGWVVAYFGMLEEMEGESPIIPRPGLRPSCSWWDSPPVSRRRGAPCGSSPPKRSRRQGR